MTKLKDPVGIKLERTTREKLKAIGIKGDTYDDVICDLLDLESGENEEGKIAKVIPHGGGIGGDRR